MEQRISDYFVQHLVKDPPPQVSAPRLTLPRGTRYHTGPQRPFFLLFFCRCRSSRASRSWGYRFCPPCVLALSFSLYFFNRECLPRVHISGTYVGDLGPWLGAQYVLFCVFLSTRKFLVPCREYGLDLLQ